MVMIPSTSKSPHPLSISSTPSNSTRSSPVAPPHSNNNKYSSIRKLLSLRSLSGIHQNVPDESSDNKNGYEYDGHNGDRRPSSPSASSMATTATNKSTWRSLRRRSSAFWNGMGGGAEGEEGGEGRKSSVNLSLPTADSGGGTTTSTAAAAAAAAYSPIRSTPTTTNDPTTTTTRRTHTSNPDMHTLQTSTTIPQGGPSSSSSSPSSPFNHAPHSRIGNPPLVHVPHNDHNNTTNANTNNHTHTHSPQIYPPRTSPPDSSLPRLPSLPGSPPPRLPELKELGLGGDGDEVGGFGVGMFDGI
ncbi:hypothetical protein MMC14_001727 [Varicellaria rhodocarpa]|nr:hypothetical protein [Varicellaria rhodocarpa]